jgi:signal transduction histidine kinase
MTVYKFSCLLISLFLVFSKVSYSQIAPFPDYYLYEDSAKALGSNEALVLFQQGEFKRTNKNSYNPGFTKSVFWLAFKNESDRPADSLLLFIGHHHINRIHFFYAADSTVVQQWETGDYYPFSQRPVNATGFYFPIAKKGLYLAQIDKSNESLQLSFRIVSKTQALAEEAKEKTIMALFTGMILLLVIFGIYLLIITKTRIYLWYVLYISAGWLWVLSNAGLGFEYLWPNQPWFASKARPVFAIAPLIFTVLFLVQYIGGIKNKRVLSVFKITNILLLCCIVTILLFNEKGYQSSWWLYIQYFIPLISLLYVVIIFVVLLISSIKGNKPAMFYLAAILALLITAILQVSFSLGQLGEFSSFFSHYGLSIGYIIEAIILTAGLVYRFNQYKLDKEKLLMEMNKRQEENNRILIEVQEAERSQVANQLHDVAGSLLSAAKLNLSSMGEKELLMNEQMKFHLRKTEEAVSMVSDMVRNLSHALSPVMLEKVGFKTSLEKVVAIVNASGKVNIQLLLIGFEKYEPGLTKYYTALYGIIYELLNNIVKHSAAKNVLVQVIEHSDCFSLVVEDDGIGIAPELIWKKQTLGIAGIRSKIDSLKGFIAFDNNKPQGLIVIIEIPITKNENKNSIGR